jgi:eukaryotic-like serine/threonine-protein kinase
MTNRLGQRLGNYRLISLLGQGGFAEVYLGEHVFLGTQAAIKVLLVRLADEEMEGFLKEARTIAGLTHPNILRVLEFGVESNVPFLVLEFAPNGTLRKRHPKGSILPLTVIVPYVSQIASALQYIHNRKLIHRDIKPENLLLGTNYEVLLSDFGTAMVFQTLHTQGTLEMAGTVSYMAPEQIRGKPRPASDQYGLGVVVYEWLCGVCPFQGSFTEMYSQHMLASPPSLCARNPTISPEVEQVVLTTLSKEPEYRFASISAFANALEQASKPDQRIYSSGSTAISQPSSRSSNMVLSEEEGLPTLNAFRSERMSGPASTTPQYATQEHTTTPGTVPVAPQPVITPEPALPPPKDESSRGIPRRSVVVGLLGLGCVAVAGGAAWLIVSKQNPFALGSNSTPTPVPGTTYITYKGHTRAVYAVAWAPKGLHIASGGVDEKVIVWDATPPAGNKLNIFLDHGGSVNALAWSPDGTRIASASSDKTVLVWDALTGVVHYKYTGHTDNVRTVAWSPDGIRIASGGDDKTVQVWNANTGNHPVTYPGHTGTVWSVSWSPDSRHIASASADKTVRVWDATSSNALVTYRGHFRAGVNGVNAVAWSPGSGQHIASGGSSPDNTVQVWEAFTGAPVLTYTEHSHDVYAVAWSPGSGQHIASSSDGQVRVWNPTPPAGKTLNTYIGNISSVKAVTWSPDGQRIASGGGDPTKPGDGDTTIRVWQAT